MTLTGHWQWLLTIWCTKGKWAWVYPSRPLFQRLEHLEYLESWEIRDRSGKVSESSGKRIGSGKMQGPTTFSRCFASHFRHLIDYGIAIIMLLEQL